MFQEDELVARSRDGDIDAFEELVSRYERKIYTIAYRLIGNYDDADDLTQEAFLRAFKSIKNFRGEASFQTWMCRIVTNVCRDEMRKRKRVVFESLDETITLCDGEVQKQIASSEPGPSELYERKEAQETIQKYINSLSPDFRVALVLRDIQGYSYEEIAQQLQCSLGTVKSRISRARNNLKNKLSLDREQNQKAKRLYG